MTKTISVPEGISRRAFFIGAAIPALAGLVKGGTPDMLRGTMEPVERGIASWYGYPFHGRRAANGEIYDMERLTAAHRTLPFDTRVRVLNLSNEQSVEVRINDRGPFIEGRVIDLSRAAARSIGLLRSGVVPVRLAVVSAPQETPADLFAVQVGAFRDVENADNYVTAMKTRYGVARLTFRDGDPPLWRVQVGCEENQQAARALARRIRAETGEPAAFVVRRDP